MIGMYIIYVIRMLCMQLLQFFSKYPNSIIGKACENFYSHIIVVFELRKIYMYHPEQEKLKNMMNL